MKFLPHGFGEVQLSTFKIYILPIPNIEFVHLPLVLLLSLSAVNLSASRVFPASNSSCGSPSPLVGSPKNDQQHHTNQFFGMLPRTSFIDCDGWIRLYSIVAMG